MKISYSIRIRKGVLIKPFGGGETESKVQQRKKRRDYATIVKNIVKEIKINRNITTKGE